MYVVTFYVCCHILCVLSYFVYVVTFCVCCHILCVWSHFVYVVTFCVCCHILYMLSHFVCVVTLYVCCHILCMLSYFNNITVSLVENDKSILKVVRVLRLSWWRCEDVLWDLIACVLVSSCQIVHRQIPEDVSLHIGLTDFCVGVKIMGFEESVWRRHLGGGTLLWR